MTRNNSTTKHTNNSTNSKQTILFISLHNLIITTVAMLDRFHVFVEALAALHSVPYVIGGEVLCGVNRKEENEGREGKKGKTEGEKKINILERGKENQARAGGKGDLRGHEEKEGKTHTMGQRNLKRPTRKERRKKEEGRINKHDKNTKMNKAETRRDGRREEE